MRAFLAGSLICFSVASAAEKPGFRVSPVPYASPVVAEQRKEAQKQHNDALEALAAGRLEDARTGFQKVLNLSPNNPAALINLGIVEQRLSNYSESERMLRRAVQAAPNSGAGWLLLGVVSLEQGKNEAAFAHFAQAVYHEPKNPQTHVYLAVSLARKGWNAAAEEEFRAALELEPKLADAHYNLAVLYLQHAPPAVELARRHYQRALDLGAAPDPAVAARFDE
jgi:tetratricopeptide (TPR) repeat protein